ncbi:hypothetical protein [Jeotgalibacillus soli]|uniref:Uncharacterized protein n=1 Tax=Jeotgalibacillus soli TaxID=889306 RepID=A0A0C2W6F7_9BACL|nr:hypothetical protein [Jeotgalibacillus soli]KIL52161.1 hypothetical protein KP78_05310 [Jeotgalibacillus soli]
MRRRIVRTSMLNKLINKLDQTLSLRCKKDQEDFIRSLDYVEQQLQLAKKRIDNLKNRENNM